MDSLNEIEFTNCPTCQIDTDGAEISRCDNCGRIMCSILVCCFDFDGCWYSDGCAYCDKHISSPSVKKIGVVRKKRNP